MMVGQPPRGTSAVLERDQQRIESTHGTPVFPPDVIFRSKQSFQKWPSRFWKITLRRQRNLGSHSLGDQGMPA